MSGQTQWLDDLLWVLAVQPPLFTHGRRFHDACILRKLPSPINAAQVTLSSTLIALRPVRFCRDATPPPPFSTCYFPARPVSPPPTPFHFPLLDHTSSASLPSWPRTSAPTAAPTSLPL